MHIIDDVIICISGGLAMHRMYPYPYWFRAQFVPVWATTTQEALELMRNAVQGERNDELL